VREEYFKGFDIILGAVDSFETRFAINRICVFPRLAAEKSQKREIGALGAMMSALFAA